MKEFIIIYFKVALVTILSIWVIGYLGSCFVDWSMLNPIKWVIELPDVSNKERLEYLSALMFMALALIMPTSIIYDDSESEALKYTPRYSGSSSALSTREQIDAVDIALGVRVV